jgi:4-amino-4-deoxy-L-arabinose transferase-like glycosyltransferase
LADVVATAVPALSEWLDLTELNQSRLAGRALSALADTATVLLTYSLGRRLRGRHVGLLAAALVAGSVLHVQLSHFYTSDTLLGPLCLAALLAMMRCARGGGAVWPAVAGAAIGLALAVKLSAAPLLAVAALAVWLRSRRADHHATIRPGLVLAVAAGLVFVAAQPFVLLDWTTFIRDVATQASIVSGRRDTVFTRQFAGRPAFVYLGWNLAMFGIGLPLAAAALAGIAAASRRFVARRSPDEAIVLAWLLAYVLITGAAYAKFLRYSLPIVPVFCVYAAVVLAPSSEPAGYTSQKAGRHRARTALRWGLALLVIIVTWGYALAHSAVYARPHPAVTASRWIYGAVPSGSTIAVEHWDEPLPLPLDDDGVFVSARTRSYTVIALPLYDDDGDGKLQQVSEALAKADWIAIYSNRLYGAIARMPDRYPRTAAYYRLLFGERLGFSLAHFSRSYPELLGITLADDTLRDAGLPTPRLMADTPGDWPIVSLGHADESYTVYDHPLVLVFRKVQPVTADEIRQAILVEAARSPAGGR